MTTGVKYRIREGVGIVTLADPPMNALSLPVRDEIAGILDRADGDERVAALILIAEGESFSVGADVREGGDGAAGGPTLRALCDRIESFAKPVIAGAQGRALGGAAEVLLAAHWRLASDDLRIGFPEVTLGRSPGAGATQRLPRLVGIDAALELLLTAQSVPAEAARRLGLVDGVVAGHLHTGTMSFARSLIASGAAPRRTRDSRELMADGRAWNAAIARVRTAAEAEPLNAPRRILDCLEAALILPFDTGQVFEAERRAEALADPQSVALAHLFAAERRIDRRLLSVVDGRRAVADPEGAAVVERLRGVLDVAAAALVAGGETPAAIDAALLGYGFPRGPFGGERFGERFFDRAGAPGPGDGIARRIVAALMAEGARCVSDGLVDRPSDIDALAVHGLGFPRRLGGPMRAAQSVGLLSLRRDMDLWSGDHDLWLAPELLLEAVKVAGGFDAVRPRA